MEGAPATLSPSVLEWEAEEEAEEEVLEEWGLLMEEQEEALEEGWSLTDTTHVRCVWSTPPPE